MPSSHDRVGWVLALVMGATPACDIQGGDDASDEGMGETDGTAQTGEPTDGTADAASTGTGDDTSDDGSTGSDTDQPLPSSIPGRECPPDSFIDADNFGMPFMTTWCAACHSSSLTGDERGGAPEGIDLDTYEGVLALLPTIYAQSADDHDMMPPAGGPTEQERILLGDWLACGAP